MFLTALTVFSPYTALLPMIYMAIKVFQNNEPINKNPWNTGLLLLFTWSLFVGILNKSLFSSAASLVILIYFFASVYIQNNFNEQPKVEKLLKYITLTSVISALIGILEKFSAEYLGTLKWGYFLGIPANFAKDAPYRIYSTFGNPNIAGNWFAVMILINLYFYYNSSDLNKKLYGFFTILFIIVLDMTGSRGAGAALLLGIIIFTILKKSKEGIVFIAFVFISVLLIMFIIPQISPKFSLINNSMKHSLNHSLISRQEIWKSSINMFRSKPITGWGLLGIYFSESDVFYFTREPHAHNLWLTIAATLGTVGLIIYFYMKYYIYESIKLLLNNGCRLVPLLASIQAVIVCHCLVDFTIMAPQGGIIFICCSSIICSLAIQYNASRVNESYLLPSPISKIYQLK